MRNPLRGFRPGRRGWLALGSVGGIGVAAIAFSLGFGLVALGSVLGSVVAGVAAAPSWTVATTKRPKRARGSRRRRSRVGRLLSGQVVPGRTKVRPWARGCGARCRMSRLPKSTCRCACGGTSHGTMR